MEALFIICDVELIHCTHMSYQLIGLKLLNSSPKLSFFLIYHLSLQLHDIFNHGDIKNKSILQSAAPISQFHASAILLLLVTGTGRAMT
jgi:hypothetical protein